MSASKYQSTREFTHDTEWILHNCIIYNGGILRGGKGRRERRGEERGRGEGRGGDGKWEGREERGEGK